MSKVSTHSVFNPLIRVLTDRQTPVTVFFRDDDAGWADEQLTLLCEVFVQQEISLDIAAIPAALSAESANSLESILATASAWLHLHQHGFTHVNNQPEGRSCEFGEARSYDQQYEDIARGQALLTEYFEQATVPIFTPPWNRCSLDTTVALTALGFAAYSRITGSTPIDTELPDLCVSIDWLKKRKGVRISEAELIQLMCRVFETGNDPVGVMLHHEHMDAESRGFLVEFIDVLRNSGKVSFRSMSQLLTC